MSTKLREQSQRGRLVNRHWEARPGALGGRGARRAFTYQAYDPAAIADDDFLLSSHIAAAAANAEQACRELNEDPLPSPTSRRLRPSFSGPSRSPRYASRVWCFRIDVSPKQLSRRMHETSQPK